MTIVRSTSRWFAGGLFAVALAAGCRAAVPHEPRTAAVVRRTVEDLFLLTGELQAVRSEELAVPPVDGWQVRIKWLAEDGAEVEAGQTVAELDNTQAAQGLEDLRLALTQAQIALEERRATLATEAPQKELEVQKAETEAAKARIEAAVPAELRSRKDWNDKQQALRKAEADFDKARMAESTFERASRAEVQGLVIARDVAARNVQAATDALEHLKLTAPKPGIVIVGRSPMEDRPIEVGDNLFPGVRIASIPDLTSMEVVAFLPEVDDGRVAVGQRVRVALETDLRKAFGGRVTAVAAVVQDGRYTGGFRVTVALDETDPVVMRPGLSARVEVIRGVFENALVVPKQAVTREGRELRVRRAGGATPADVRIAACLPLDCVVAAGLSEGDRVVLR
jgi:multidrug efflux pump subunit AcrA (membrane-fusion protein)